MPHSHSPFLFCPFLFPPQDSQQAQAKLDSDLDSYFSHRGNENGEEVEGGAEALEGGEADKVEEVVEEGGEVPAEEEIQVFILFFILFLFLFLFI